MMAFMDADTTAVPKPVVLTTDPSQSKDGTLTVHVATAPAFTRLHRRTAG